MSFTESCQHPPRGGAGVGGLGGFAGPAGAPSPWLTASLDPGLKSVWFEIQAGLVSSLAPIYSRYYFLFIEVEFTYVKVTTLK